MRCRNQENCMYIFQALLNKFGKRLLLMLSTTHLSREEFKRGKKIQGVVFEEAHQSAGRENYM